MSGDRKYSLPGMERGGFYNQNSTLQNAAIQKIIPLWREIVKTAALKDGSVTIADYGSSEGRNSMAPLSLAVEMLRDMKGPNFPINVVHTDLPGNDFSALFQTILEDEKSYLKLGEDIYPSAIGRSYFEQILPPASVDLAWNTWTLQWMSKNPVEDPDFLYGAYSQKEWVRECVQKQLAEDWREFLRLRSIELKPGGGMLCLFGSKGSTMLGWEWTLNAFWSCIVDMHREGLLSDEDKLRINLPLGPRDVGAIKEPFGDSGLYEGLMLEHAEVMQSPDPYWAEYQNTKDKKQFGQNWKNFMKAVFSPVLRSQLDPSKDTSMLVENIFERFAMAVSSDPRETEHFVGIAILKKLQIGADHDSAVIN
jgi:SAM dependent carboxyl methyltransferase